MNFLANMHPVSVVVIIMILTLFVLSVVLLMVVSTSYRKQKKLATVGDTHRSTLVRDVLQEFTAAYNTFGQETNTPAIITSVMHEDMSFFLFCERFLNNAVSLFVTMGLLGTFLGLSLSVSSLSQLLGSTADWQNALNNMGSGLLSALSGMGVAFYTSLVGVGCSIVLTVLRSIFSPEAIREELETELELWLDHRVAPRLGTDRPKEDSQLVKQMIGGLNAAAAAINDALKGTTDELQQSLTGFNATVDCFNQGVRDFSEFDYNLRGTVEKMDVAVRDLTAAIRRVARNTEGSEKNEKSPPRSRKESNSSGEQGFWPSYTDMMSAVALILFFLMLLAYIQNIITNNDLSHKEEELRDTINQLASVTQQVRDKESELQEASDNLETARKDLDDQQVQLDSQHASIIEQANMILQQQTDIENQKATIEQQKEWIAQQQQYLDDTQAELTQVRGQMQAAAFLRVDIVEKIRESAESVLGTNSSISVSETGSLVLSESVLFDRGSPALKANSKAVLDQLAIGFANFLANSDSAQYVDTIVIGGHADSTGDESYNRSLSSNRATNVLQYLLTTQDGILSPYAQYFCAAGYGSTRPVASNDTSEGQAQNRRIEISITLKDESVLDALEQYLAIKVPGQEG